MDTNLKGDIALAQVILDLTKKNADIFIPINDHPKTDLICCVNNNLLRLQVKYSKNGIIKNYTIVDSKGTRKFYDKNDFDYYAVYLSEIDICVYIPITLGVNTCRYTEPESNSSFWWYKDFLNFNSNQAKRSYKEIFGNRYKPNKTARKVDWPEKSKLKKLVWQKPLTKIAKDFGVSDKTISKWCEIYEIEKPPRGYWIKNPVEV